MMRRGGTVFAICCLLAGPTAVTAQAEAPQEAQEAQEAHEAADSWLALVDVQEYAASWEAAARSFQAAVAAEAWAAQLTAGRAQVGAVEDRELARSRAMTDPPGAPPGEYMQLHYESTFSGAGRVVENVVLVRDGDRGWRVAGYFIQPAG
jgi:hypothetical protein